MPAFYRDSPTRLTQERSTCWAAAAEAFTEHTRGQEHLSYIELLDEAKAAKQVAWNGALRGEDGIRWLATRLNLRFENGSGLATHASMLPRLRKSHVIFMYRQTNWKVSIHTVCVWGTDENIVAAMDPMIGQWTFRDPADFDHSWELCLWQKD